MDKRIKVFNDRFPLVGPDFWIVTVQYFITQLVAALYWSYYPYSITRNTISDLGNTACGIYSDRFVCSPLYSWMNSSFIVFGLTMIAGSSLIYQEFRKNSGSRLGFSLMALAGVGTIMVGLFPENTIGVLHFAGALLAFVLGNIALLVFAFSLGLGPKFRNYTIFSGLIALVGLVLFELHIYLGIGQGGMERIVAYPQGVWLIFFGLYMSRNHFKK